MGDRLDRLVDRLRHRPQRCFAKCSSRFDRRLRLEQLEDRSLLSATPITAVFQDGRTYSGTRDTQISGSSPTANYGTLKTLSAGRDMASLMRWDIAGIPAGSVVQSVKLSLYVTDATSQAYELYALTRDWSETGATWQNAVAGTPWQAAGAIGAGDRASTVLGSVTAPTVGAKTFNLNAAGVATVQGWIDNPALNRGLILQDYANADTVQFGSRENGNTSRRPKLEVTYSSNQAPAVSAGPDRQVTLSDALALDGTVTDDGLPNPPGMLTTAWTQISGPGAVTFANASAVDTDATFSTAGAYVLRLTASDGAIASWDEVTVTVVPPNQAPVVSAGPDQQVTLSDALALDGTVTDDGLPNPPGTLTTAWTQISGPGAVTFANASAVDTDATFSAAGDYVLRLTASDGAIASWDEVTVTVAPPPNQAPVISAGPDRQVTLSDALALDGTVTDDGLPNPPGTLTTAWTQISGPGAVTFANASSVDTTATFSAAGAYVLRLTASDGAIASWDEVTVSVGEPIEQTQGIWISRDTLMSLPTGGAAWDTLVAAANTVTSVPNIANQDDDTDVLTLAEALVGVRTGNQLMMDQAQSNIMAAIGTETGGRSLALARNLASYVIAADVVGLTAAQDAQFRDWLRTVLTETMTDGRTLQTCHEDRPNNWGTMAGASRAAVAVYLNDSAELARTAQVFGGWLGDRASYAGFNYGSDLSWQADPTQPVGINPMGAVKDGQSIDGALPEEMRRGGLFQWPPTYTNYPWEALQGAFVQAEILYRAGYDTYQWQDQALLRAVQFLYGLGWDAVGDDQWLPWLVNARYGTTFPAVETASHGKIMGWTSWTHQAATIPLG